MRDREKKFKAGPMERRVVGKDADKKRLVSVVSPGWLEHLAAKSHKYSEVIPFEDARIEAEASARSRLMMLLQREIGRRKPPRMNPEDSLIMLLCVRDGLSRREISAAMRKPEGNVTRAFRRAIRWLRMRMAEDSAMSYLAERLKELERASEFYY